MHTLRWLSLTAVATAALLGACAGKGSPAPTPTTPPTAVTLPPEPLAGLDPAPLAPSLEELGDVFASYETVTDQVLPNPDVPEEGRPLTEMAKLGRITGYVRQFRSPDETLVLGLTVHVFAEEEGASAAVAFLRDGRLATPGNELQDPIAVGDEVVVLLINATTSVRTRDVTFRVGPVVVNLYLQPQPGASATAEEFAAFDRAMDELARRVEGKVRAALAALP